MSTRSALEEEAKPSDRHCALSAFSWVASAFSSSLSSHHSTWTPEFAADIFPASSSRELCFYSACAARFARSFTLSAGNDELSSSHRYCSPRAFTNVASASASESATPTSGNLSALAASAAKAVGEDTTLATPAFAAPESWTFLAPHKTATTPDRDEASLALLEHTSASATNLLESSELSAAWSGSALAKSAAEFGEDESTSASAPSPAAGFSAWFASDKFLSAVYRYSSSWTFDWTASASSTFADQSGTLRASSSFAEAAFAAKFVEPVKPAALASALPGTWTWFALDETSSPAHRYGTLVASHWSTAAFALELDSACSSSAFKASASALFASSLVVVRFRTAWASATTLSAWFADHPILGDISVRLLPPGSVVDPAESSCIEVEGEAPSESESLAPSLALGDSHTAVVSRTYRLGAFVHSEAAEFPCLLA